MNNIKLKTVFIGSKKNMFGDYITGQNYYIPTQVDAVISGLQSECENERVLKERALQKVRELEDKVLELNKDNYTLQATYNLRCVDGKTFNDMERTIDMLSAMKAGKDFQLYDMTVSFWNMTAEWADAMGLASCNIANKFFCRNRQKYRHRQDIFRKYANYCRKKAEACKL